MTVLPGQKLSIGEMFVSLAAGLMLFLLPNDARNQFEGEAVCYSFIFIVSFVIVATLFIVLKRYEAVGTAMLAMAVITLARLIISVISGIVSKGTEYWPKITEYNIVSLFLTWIIPFGISVALRLVSGISSDSNEKRRSFARFVDLSMKALLIIYIIVIIFKLIIPVKPKLEGDREYEFMFFKRINDCLSGEYKNGMAYIIWHLIILSPFTFYLSVLIPKLRMRHSAVISLAVGLAIEALQFLFNTGTACVDDIMMYMVGAVCGVMLKLIINAVRSRLTGGMDRCMLGFEYMPIPRKPKGEAQVIEEE